MGPAATTAGMTKPHGTRRAPLVRRLDVLLLPLLHLAWDGSCRAQLPTLAVACLSARHGAAQCLQCGLRTELRSFIPVKRRV